MDVLKLLKEEIHEGLYGVCRVDDNGPEEKGVEKNQ